MGRTERPPPPRPCPSSVHTTPAEWGWGDWAPAFQRGNSLTSPAGEGRWACTPLPRRKPWWPLSALIGPAGGTAGEGAPRVWGVGCGVGPSVGSHVILKGGEPAGGFASCTRLRGESVCGKRSGGLPVCGGGHQAGLTGVSAAVRPPGLAGVAIPSCGSPMGPGTGSCWLLPVGACASVGEGSRGSALPTCHPRVGGSGPEAPARWPGSQAGWGCPADRSLLLHPAS